MVSLLLDHIGMNDVKGIDVAYNPYGCEAVQHKLKNNLKTKNAYSICF